MESARWLVLSPLVLAIAAGSLAPGRVAGGPVRAGWDPPPCAAEASEPPGGTAWYRLDPVLDRGGTLAARRLALGVERGPSRLLDLAPESFASGPVAGRILVGEDDGAVSRLALLDPVDGCATAVAEVADVVRSAILAPDAGSLYEHRVDRATRADLGVWRRDLGGGDGPVRVLDGLAPDARLGPTFVTDLVLAADGRLVASSCAPGGCRVRVLDPSGGGLSTLRDTGPALGVSGEVLVVRATCGGWPCAIEAVDLASGRRSTLAPAAFAAVLVGDRLVLETVRSRIRVVDVRSGRTTADLAPGAVPLRGGSTSTAGAGGPDGWTVLATGGRPGTASLRRLDPATGALRSGTETSR